METKMTLMRDFEIVEKSLSDMLDHNFIDADCYGSLLPYLKKIKEELKEGEKSKRALEIIKRITFYDIRFLDYLLRENIITQEEYDLLKEVLIC